MRYIVKNGEWWLARQTTTMMWAWVDDELCAHLFDYEELPSFLVQLFRGGFVNRNKEVSIRPIDPDYVEDFLKPRKLLDAMAY